LFKAKLLLYGYRCGQNYTEAIELPVTSEAVATFISMWGTRVTSRKII